MALAIRGGKKKKGGGGADTSTDSTDIVNIWKDRPDPVIRPIEDYPKFVSEQLLPHYSTDDVVFQLYRGERMPTPKEQWSLAQNARRTWLVDKNKLARRDWMYESSDDEGENLGSAIVIDEDDGYDDGDDDDGPKKPKTEEELMREELEASTK